jgi:hypothetical protein
MMLLLNSNFVVEMKSLLTAILASILALPAYAQNQNKNIPYCQKTLTGELIDGIEYRTDGHEDSLRLGKEYKAKKGTFHIQYLTDGISSYGFYDDRTGLEVAVKNKMPDPHFYYSVKSFTFDFSKKPRITYLDTNGLAIIKSVDVFPYLQISNKSKAGLFAAYTNGKWRFIPYFLAGSSLSGGIEIYRSSYMAALRIYDGLRLDLRIKFKK